MASLSGVPLVTAGDKEGAAPRPINARQKRIAKSKPFDEFPEEFTNLWDKIKLKPDTKSLLISRS
jgi:hypothetical protein